MKWRHGSYAPVKKQNKPHSTSSKIAGKTAGISTKQLENKNGPDKNQVELSRERERERESARSCTDRCTNVFGLGLLFPGKATRLGSEMLDSLKYWRVCIFDMYGSPCSQEDGDVKSLC